MSHPQSPSDPRESDPTATDRLPPGTGPGPVRLLVSDLQRSTGWYRSILGLEVVSESGGGLVLGAGADGTPLVELVEHPGAKPVPVRSRLGLFHFAILLPDRAALGSFLAHLNRSGIRAGSADHAVSEALYLQDPDGLGIEIYADRPRDTWRFRGEELVMTTEPLDLDDLLQAGAGAPWRTIPSGSVMGHIHLHVGNLEDAADFYHRSLGFERTVWSYPGALFLSAGGYHHHLGVNVWAGRVGPASRHEARLLEWELQVPTADAAAEAFERLRRDGHDVEVVGDEGRVADPWGTMMRIRQGSAGVTRSP